MNISIRKNLNRQSRSGFTLIELLIAATLSVIVLGLLVVMFGNVSNSINNSSSTMRMNDRKVSASEQLRRDLQNMTAPLTPPLSPKDDLGFTEIYEGLQGPRYAPETKGYIGSHRHTQMITNYVSGGVVDSTQLQAFRIAQYESNALTGSLDARYGDSDDMLHFTIRSKDRAYTGVSYGQTAQSVTAEVIWYLRGITLYRRQLLVTPGRAIDQFGNGDHYRTSDISARIKSDPDNYEPTSPNPQSYELVANTLGDLTKHHNRYGHVPTNNYPYPGDTTNTKRFATAAFWGFMGYPNLAESSVSDNGKFFFLPRRESGNADLLGWNGSYNNLLLANVSNFAPYKPLAHPDNNNFEPIIRRNFDRHKHFKASLDVKIIDNNDALGIDGSTVNVRNTIDMALLDPSVYPRAGEDVVMTNVVGFDVKVWDDNAPIFRNPNPTSPNDVVKPGDFLYPAAVSLFRPGNAATHPVAFGAYVDLGYLSDFNGGGFAENYVNEMVNPTMPTPLPFTQLGSGGMNQSRYYNQTRPPANLHFTSPLFNNGNNADNRRYFIYDTFSDHYEYDGISDRGQGSTVVTAPPPYSTPLKGIQVTIRVFDPRSNNISDVVVQHNF